MQPCGAINSGTVFFCWAMEAHTIHLDTFKNIATFACVLKQYAARSGYHKVFLALNIFLSLSLATCLDVLLCQVLSLP